MRPDEAWFFKQYDTRSNVAQVSFHSSAKDPCHAQDQDLPERASVELRFLLTFPPAQGQGAAVAKL